MERKQEEAPSKAPDAKKLRTTNLQQPKPSDDDLGISMPGLVLFNSKPGGGKSHALRYLMYRNQRRFAHGIAFSKSAFRPGNLEYVPNFTGVGEDKDRYLNFKHMVFNEQVLREFLDGQARYPEGERPLGFIIFDDDISDKNMWNCSAMIDAVTMYRHYNIVLFICVQYINKVSTTVRECASQVALFKMDSKRSIEAAYDSYGQEFEDADQFKKWLFEATQPATEHKFAWKDKMNDRPWIVARAPEVIPPFRLDYGRKEKETKKRKRQGSKNGAAKRSKTNPMLNDFNAVLSIAKLRGGGQVLEQ